MLKNTLYRFTPDLSIALGLFLLPILFFAPITLGGRTLIPADNLYQYEPWASYRAEQGVPEVPHNALLSDLIFQNYQWKTFLRQSISAGEIPLWQTNQFSGAPFLANGQHSAYYPFSAIYYILPLWLAYGWFMVSQLWLAGLLMYGFMRGLGLSRPAGLIAGVSYQLSSFLIVSAVHPMIQASAVWLPLLLWMLENILLGRSALPQKWRKSIPSIFDQLPWALIGGMGLGMNFLAGHIEITYYTLLVMALYAALRLLWDWFKEAKQAAPLPKIALMLLLVGLGFGIGAVQFIPNLEAANYSFRTERSSLEEVRGYALPYRHVAKWIVPNVYGNPSQHGYWDVFEGDYQSQNWDYTAPDGQTSRVTNTDYDVKNYVEGGVYIGILPLFLAVLGLIYGKPRRYILIFGLIALVSLLFMFGTPFYAMLYYLFPGVNQLHTPFRWAWPLTVILCSLAGFGAEVLVNGMTAGATSRSPLPRIAYLLMGASGLLIGGLLISRLAYNLITDSFAERVYTGLAGATRAFPTAQAFYSYQFVNLLIFALMLGGIGLIIYVNQKGWQLKTMPLWLVAAIGLIALDSYLAVGDFNPRAKRDWLTFTPSAITWLQEQESQSQEAYRLQAFNWGEDPLIANTGWSYGLHDVRGYDSLFSKQYADFMGQITPQTGLAFNRIDPILYNNPQALLALQWDWLGVRYFLTDWIIRPQEEFGVTDLAEVGLQLAYEGEGIRIYENTEALPQAYSLPLAEVDKDGYIDFEQATLGPVTITDYQSSTVFTDVTLNQDGWLILSDTYAPGWRAFVRPLGTDESEEDEIDVHLIQGNFRGVKLDAGDWTVRWRYSPQSFQLGAFSSFISGMLVIFLALLWLWTSFVGESADQSPAGRVIKNSLAPILLNLFNRGIDFAFAFVMLRILAPEGAGIYYYAIVIFGWFDILTNFGLNTLLTRDVARDPSKARHYLLNTTLLRLILAGVGVGALAIFLFIRNTAIQPALDTTAITAILLLYVGLLPNSISTGLTALFYAFEKAEYPAALATVTTLIKVTLGLGALLLGWGVIGLAGVSIITNFITMSLMLRLALPLIQRVATGSNNISKAVMRSMVIEAYPLMLNHLLATIFFKIDVVLMEAINGAAVVGVYSTAYKWLDALNIIPAFFTLALLPMMSRQAQEDKPALTRHYVFALKILVMVALPIAVITTFIARGLIGVLGGPEFLPDGGIALQLMIWSIPIGWINSLTQYVLIALNRQRQITGAFVVAVSFNIIGNLVFLPLYSFRAAAITTILSEGVLLVGFYWLLRRDLHGVNYFYALWKPILVAGVMAGGMLALWTALPLLAVLGGIGIYLGGLIFLNPFTLEETGRLGRFLPVRLRKAEVSEALEAG